MPGENSVPCFLQSSCFAEHSVLSSLLSLARALFTFNVVRVLYLNLHRIAMMFVAQCIRSK